MKFLFVGNFGAFQLILGRAPSGECIWGGNYNYLGPDSILKKIWYEGWISTMDNVAEGVEKLEENPLAGTSIAIAMMAGGRSPSGKSADNINRTIQIVTKNGIKINGFTWHGIQRVIGNMSGRAGTKPQAILDALKNPIKTQKGIAARGKSHRI